jgi:HSP20 family protein
MFVVPMNREARQLSRLFDDAFDRFFSPAALPDGVASRSPALDVSETEQAYTVKLEMPGVTKDEVRVSVDGRQVTVQAESQHKPEKKEGERIVYRERSTTSYARTFTLPLEVDQTDAGAKLDHGVLTLTLPKRSARAAARISVN